MSAQTNPEFSTRRSGGIVAGSILIACGLLAAVSTIPGVTLGSHALTILSAIFFVAGFVSRSAPLLIPACILAGVSTGVYLTNAGPGFHGAVDAGVMLLSIAGGFGLITLTHLALRKVSLWPLIPASIISVFGVALLGGEASLGFLNLVRYIWPVCLILLGGALILKRK